MRRREMVAAGCCAVSGMIAGCLDGNDSAPVPEIVSIELRNDRQEQAHEVMVQIEDRMETSYEETYHLEAADSSDSVVELEDPVDPGNYTVRVEAEEYSATVDTQNRITKDQTCIRLEFYLTAKTIHSEYRLYDRCE